MSADLLFGRNLTPVRRNKKVPLSFQSKLTYNKTCTRCPDYPGILSFKRTNS